MSVRVRRALFALLLLCAPGVTGHSPSTDSPYLIVLGIAQDGGIPQAGAFSDSAWEQGEQRRLVASLGLVDPASGKRWLFEATPDFRDQLHRLRSAEPMDSSSVPAGIFLTHAHIGHYTGLMFLGHESIGANGVPVFATSAMASFLRENGPWSQLVRYRNIDLQVVTPGEPVRLSDQLAVTPIAVPHRQEYSDVLGFLIDGPERSVLFIPDIDSWEEWEKQGVMIEELIRKVDAAYVDGTFFRNGEIPGRDMSAFPHPFITHSMERFGALPPEEREKIRFIHFNHTNRAGRRGTPEREEVLENGYRLAEEGERIGL